jgi:hypothetical protein
VTLASEDNDMLGEELQVIWVKGGKVDEVQLGLF